MNADIRVTRTDWGKNHLWFALSVSRLLLSGGRCDERGISVLRQPDGQYRITAMSRTEDQCAHAAVVFLDRGELLELRDALAGAEVRT